MVTYDGVKREARCRLRLEGKPFNKIRDLVKDNFISYDTLEKATGVNFKDSDDLAKSIGLREEDLVRALFV